MSAPEHDVRLSHDSAVPAGEDGRNAFGRSFHLAVLVAALALLLFWYRDTVGSLLAIWSRSDTYAHGFIVAPITCWLIWRNRARLRGLPLAPSLPGALAAAAAGFAWMLGELASVASVSQFAFVGMIIALVWAIAGTAIARSLAFPLGFLFFSVPFGEFLFPSMMDRTADFVVWGLRLSGVPVYAEGRDLVIPSGHWAIVEGCSGVRYLIASVVVGSLYAYLTYRSLRRRLIFIGLSVLLPILANWLRAYGIVMLAHFSNNRIAAGVDHLVYGWVFFGVVMLMLFWIGGRWREDEVPVAPPAASATAGGVRPAAAPWMVAGFLFVALAAVLGWKPALGMLNEQGQHGSVRLSALQPQGAWQPAAADRLPVWSPRYSGMRSESRAAWEADGQPVGLYIAYYRDQMPGEELINSENRVLQSKDPVWMMKAYGEHEAQVGARGVKVGSIEMASADGRLLVWHGYWIGGRWTTNDYVAKLYLVASRLGGSGDDSAAVMVYAPFAVEERGRAEAALESFMREMGPAVDEMLTTAMER
ncbi:exosortase A [Aromatoleum anaerobium]|uniref:Exosortase A n=1 Tax=Aromatoleum anaerobium TaxID=182180 RepID=A0ABX1PG08_9RHOO|nr:exosortase A [Aromatoleum anaerobium]MCK0509222.1 exosortase A [Aromatoleum anaerobium]